LDINCVDLDPKSKNIIATCDDFSKIKLFKFPSSKENA
jgi:hypothetical protein